MPDLLDDREQLEPPRTLQTLDVALTVNGQPWRGEVPVEAVLLDFLRERLGLTGCKRSCESQTCGACTVLVDDQPVSACALFVFEARGRAVRTIEGLADGEQLDPLQSAFVRNVGSQCGYCTPGQIMSAKALLIENQAPSYEQIVAWMSGNACRCGSYLAIAQSIEEAAAEGRGERPG